MFRMMIRVIERYILFTKFMMETGFSHMYVDPNVQQYCRAMSCRAGNRDGRRYIQEMANSWLSAFIYSDSVCATQRAYACQQRHACVGWPPLTQTFIGFTEHMRSYVSLTAYQNCNSPFQNLHNSLLPASSPQVYFKVFSAFLLVDQIYFLIQNYSIGKFIIYLLFINCSFTEILQKY